MIKENEAPKQYNHTEPSFSSVESKEAQRQEIEKQIQEFLQRGGQIEVIESGHTRKREQMPASNDFDDVDDELD